MKIIRIAAVLFVMLMLCGCGGSLELEERELITAMGIDKKDEEFQISLSAGEESPIVIRANSLDSCFSQERGKKLYFGLTKVCVIGSSIMENGETFSEVRDYLEKNNNISRKVIMVCCEGESKDIIEEMKKGNEIYEYYEVNKNHYRRYLENIIQDMLCQNSTIIPLIDKSLMPDGAIILKNGEKTAKIDGQELDGFVMLDNHYGNIKIKKNASYDGENIFFNVYIDSNEDMMKIREKLEKAFRYMTDSGADIGVSEFIRKNHYKIFKEFGGSREEMLQKCKLMIYQKDSPIINISEA